MQIVVVGVNQQTAPVAVRERLAIGPDRLPAALARLAGVAAEGFILSTCNRVEIYALMGHSDSGGAGLARLLAAEAGLSPAALTPHLYSHAHAAAVGHFFRVAAGLDSMVVGEDQILAQVKGALDSAQAAATLGPILYRLGHMALAAGKDVRTRTALNRHHLSVVSVALQLAATALGELHGRSVLVLGAGRTAELVLKHLSGAAPGRVTVINRTATHAADLAARYGAVARSWPDLEAALAAADIVISCTGAPATVIDAALVARARAAAEAAPLLCIDLAVPRDIAPAVAALPGVTLYDVDRLQAICAGNRQQRSAEVDQAMPIVTAAVHRYLAWWQARTVTPTIRALHAQAAAIRDAEVARTLARLPGLSPREQAAVQYLAEALVNKLLHGPVTTLKAAPEGANLAEAVQQLFALPLPAAHDAAPIAHLAAGAPAAPDPPLLPSPVPAVWPHPVTGAS